MSETLNKKTNYNGIDLAKFISAFLVISIHCSPLQSFNPLINSFFVNVICRFAVPFFFACSGFFFFKGLQYENEKIKKCKYNRNRLFNYISRLFILYLIWSSVYFCYQFFIWCQNDWLSLNIFLDYIKNFFIDKSYYHTWYILSLMYATLFGYILLLLFKRKVVMTISLVFYVLGLFLHPYRYIIFSVVPCLNEIVPIIDNAIWVSLIRALPFMLVGYFIGTSKLKLTIRLNVIVFFISSVCLCIEVLLLYLFFDGFTEYSFVFFTIPCIVLLLNLLLSIDIKGNNKSFIFLRNSSTIIYCVHPLIINLLSLFPIYFNFSSLIQYICVGGISLGLSCVMIKLSQKKKLSFLKKMM